MSEFFSPYDADRPLTLRCSCGRDHSAAEHQAEQASGQAIAELRRRAGTTDFEAYSREFIEATLVKALFPQDAVRRRFLRALGKSTAVALGEAGLASTAPSCSAGPITEDLVRELHELRRRMRGEAR